MRFDQPSYCRSKCQTHYFVVTTYLLLTRHILCTTGMYGQLGHGDKEKQVTPKIVDTLSDKSVYLLACGNFHTVSLIIIHPML